MAKNANLHAAKSAKNDEFYTQLSDIENEMKHYREHFRDKVVYCNCDDPRNSKFFTFFSLNFEFLGLKELICTAYNDNGHGVVYSYKGDKNGNGVVDQEEIEVRELEGDGDFRSEECIEILQRADIVVTNPPFSLFREFVAQLVEYGKKFLIIGNQNAITYKEVFPLIKDNQMWLGVSMNGSNRWFGVPDDYPILEKVANSKIEDDKKFLFVNGVVWFTNLDHKRRHQPLDLYKYYSQEEFPHYDNYDAINVNKVSDIPMDWDGVIGVPISYLHKYCFEQFEIVDARCFGLNERQRNKNTFLIKDADGAINGKPTYARICIRHKK